MNALGGGAPRDAVAVLARLTGVRVAETRLDELFAREPNPLSLMALVRAASEIGLDVRAYEASFDDLTTLPTPLVLHLHSADGGRFVVAAQVDPDGIEVREIDGIARRIERDQFVRVWSGIVVPVERAGGRPPMSVPVRPPSRGMPSVRAAAAGLGLALVALAAVRSVALAVGSESGGVLGRLFAPVAPLAALIGAVASGLLLRAARRTRGSGGMPRLVAVLCRGGPLTDCGSVLASRFARIGGVDLSAFGLAFFLAILATIVVGAGLPEESATALFSWLAAVFVLASPPALVLTVLQLWPLRRICPLCMAVHASVVIAAGLGVSYVLDLPSPLTLARSAWTFPLLHTAALLLAIGVLVPLIESRWELSATRSALDRVHGTSLGALAELAGAPQSLEELVPAIDVGGGEAGGSSPTLRIDAFVHPTCEHCPALIEGLFALVDAHGARIRVGLHLAQREPGHRGERELLAALAATARSAGPRDAVAAMERVHAAPARHLVAAGEDARAALASWTPDPGPAAAALDECRALVDAASGAAHRLGVGIPGLFVERRAWDAPLELLAGLIERDFELVCERLGVAPRPAPP